METGKAKWIVLVALALVYGAVAGCNQERPAETAGKKIDQTVASAQKTIAETAQKAERKLDQATNTVAAETGKVGQSLDDSAITAKVKTAIVASEPAFKGFNINVDTTNGAVTLTGIVDSAKYSDRAREIAVRVEGVKSVDNRLTVKGTNQG
jgi:hyperosmotically inducible periplasmic protein